jgi:hypothetical protein
MTAYAKAGGYGAVPSFDAYPITGDAEGWLASIGIPAITVELETRTSIEWTRNLGGRERYLKPIREIKNSPQERTLRAYAFVGVYLLPEYSSQRDSNLGFSPG